MNKEKVIEQINENIRDAQDLLKEAGRLADRYNIPFKYRLPEPVQYWVSSDDSCSDEWQSSSDQCEF
jgi:hypothetical protein